MPKHPKSHLAQRLLSRVNRITIRNGDLEGQIIELKLLDGADQNLSSSWTATVGKIGDSTVRWSCSLADLPRGQELLDIAIESSKARMARVQKKPTEDWSRTFWAEIKKNQGKR